MEVDATNVETGKFFRLDRRFELESLTAIKQHKTIPS